MEIEKFKEILKTCKKSESRVLQDLRVIRSSPTCISVIRVPKKDMCLKCGTDLTKNTVGKDIEFINPVENLTIFQVGMLFDVFVRNKIPLDYAGYHNCIAGKKFIENIKEIK